MLSDFTGADRVYLAVGYTDLRKGIDGLASLVQQQFDLDPFTNTLFLFCGRRRDRLKALLGRRRIPASLQAAGGRRFSLAQKRGRGAAADAAAVPLAYGRAAN